MQDDGIGAGICDSDIFFNEDTDANSVKNPLLYSRELNSSLSIFASDRNSILSSGGNQSELDIFKLSSTYYNNLNELTLDEDKDEESSSTDNNPIAVSNEFFVSNENSEYLGEGLPMLDIPTEFNIIPADIEIEEEKDPNSDLSEEYSFHSEDDSDLYYRKKRRRCKKCGKYTNCTCNNMISSTCVYNGAMGSDSSIGSSSSTSSSDLNESACPSYSPLASSTITPPAQCYGPGKKRKRITRPWTEKENEKLLNACKELSKKKMQSSKYWKEVALKLTSKRTPKQCREHYKYITSSNKRSTWSKEEDAILMAGVRKNLDFDEIRTQLKRSNKQIKERLRIINRDTKPWTEEEDKLLSVLYFSEKKNRNIVKILRENNFIRTSHQVKDRIAYLKKQNHH